MKYYLLHVLTIDREALPPIILIPTCVKIPAKALGIVLKLYADISLRRSPPLSQLSATL